MLCPYCGKENANAFGYCNSCGNPMVPVTGVSPGAAPAPGFDPSRSKTMSPLAWIPIFLTVGLACFLAADWPLPPGEKSVGPFRAGVLLAMLVPAFIVAFLAGGIKKWRSPNRFAVVFFIVGVGLTSLGWLGSQIEEPEAQIARLMREAAGQQPIRKALWASDQRFDNLVREQFSKVIQLNREYGELAASIKAPEISKVARPESFVDPTYAAEGVQQLHETYLLDQQIAQKLTQIADNLRHAVDVTDWSERKKEQFFQGFERGFAESMEKRRGLVDAEQAYVEATDNLYDYSNSHYRDFHLVDGHLRIADDSLRTEFNLRMRTYNARRSDLIRVREEFRRTQSATLSKFGMSPKDVGLK